MNVKRLAPDLSVAGQIRSADMAALAQAGFRSVICNRPDGEGADQPGFPEIEAAARAAGIEARYLPVVSGQVSDGDAAAFGVLLSDLPGPVLAYCRTGTRSTTLWSLSEAARGRPLPDILSAAEAAGYDMTGAVRRVATGGRAPGDAADLFHSVVVVGGGAGGIAVAASLKARKPDLDIALIDPADMHYYQPGWTMVGGGIFSPAETARTMASLIPAGVRWIKAAVAAFEPERKAVVLEGCRVVRYDRLVVAPGLSLDWSGIEGLPETLGRNGVTSNYRYDLAPYTWDLVQNLRTGRAVFTQPPMPIKCAGAPQKAMYLSADHWLRRGRLKDIDIAFYNAGAVLFGVKDYVAPLMEYVRRYDAQLHFQHRLTRIDGPGRRAWFTRTTGDGGTETVETDFDMIHVVPPQRAPDFVRASPLADAGGWVEVDPASLRHARHPGIYALGDVTNAPNAKTAAAARKQAPVVAHNLLLDMGYLRGDEVAYDGYGSCPLTVERGKILLAEFGYGGKLLPSFPAWLIDGTKPSHMAWLLKERMLPPIYWKAMLKGREWMATPRPGPQGAGRRAA
ncbi:bifunctional protein tyrosine phosphatase family protein/NAD(P)/FAD-dependent oxidoreductase [Methylobacterium ajmalii]|jgi:sulfide:quinone oxidoreductase|uniref:bifunctional protein tyrosine phosphatase family protein/NAD(P)/FAD-dependent oxidoreductase n=1 Tax=Methylobacterium ajmalii TaxID=2738439 RepID=UPI00190AA197|nr:bifunctional protein tyrosine phosphatase family protein/NAD(P)/FAD-dependent oxidoreductase [Methylobacterium ajmalii]MBK3398077.1 TIGR01244 family phosphatase [Methylobacterium ajmalii]MBK3406891.1 TIGR01244 family phosphatase [Methylobacterium ajmalii]MBK3424546.1 TIGR01244 family phosphatase [Methylobacterium ajmalii]MBZ6416491.1 TIGR01244 family phosphatase [Methylobacterium sp.]